PRAGRAFRVRRSATRCGRGPGRGRRDGDRARPGAEAALPPGSPRRDGALVAAAGEHLGCSNGLHLREPLRAANREAGRGADRAQGSVIEDVDGNRYVDLIGGIGVNSLGHRHPAWTKALHEQLDKVTVGSFTSAPRADLINEVAKVTPKGVDKVQLYSSGAEA